MKLQWYWSIHHVQNQPNLCWVNLEKSHINLSLNPWIPFKGFNFKLLQNWLQNIYVSTLTNSLYTILHIKDPTLDPYSIFHFHWPNWVQNVSLEHLSILYIKMVISAVNIILMACFAAQFWYEIPTPLNISVCCFFNRFFRNSEV